MISWSYLGRHSLNSVMNLAMKRFCKFWVQQLRIFFKIWMLFMITCRPFIPECGRHPSDVLIPDSGEYADYSEYNALAPVAKEEIDDGMKNSSVVTPGTDIVTCISCHRPHGSPYPDMLRWDYASCQAGAANSECGCFICHTAKDD